MALNHFKRSYFKASDNSTITKTSDDCTSTTPTRSSSNGSEGESIPAGLVGTRLVKRLPVIAEYVTMAVTRQGHRHRHTLGNAAKALLCNPVIILPAPLGQRGRRRCVESVHLEGAHADAPVVLAELGPDLLHERPIVLPVVPGELLHPAGAAAKHLLPGEELRRKQHRILRRTGDGRDRIGVGGAEEEEERRGRRRRGGRRHLLCPRGSLSLHWVYRECCV